MRRFDSIGVRSRSAVRSVQFPVALVFFDVRLDGEDCVTGVIGGATATLTCELSARTRPITFVA